MDHRIELMASADIDQLTDALAKTHVGVELSYKGQGLKLNDKQSGGNIFFSITLHVWRLTLHNFTYGWCFVLALVEKIVLEIEQFHGLKALRLEGNTLGVEAAQAISKALESKKDLQVSYLFNFRLCVCVRIVSHPLAQYVQARFWP